MNPKVKNKTLQSSLDKAVALQHDGELDADEKLFKQGLALEPRHPAALYLLAALATVVSEFAQVLSYIESMLVSHHSVAQAHAQTVKVAMGVLQALTPAAVVPIMALSYPAIALQSEGEHAQGIVIFTQLMQLTSQDFSGFN